MASNNIERKVEELLEKPINDLGYDLYDVRYEKDGKDYYLRVIIDTDKEEGISIDDCEKVNYGINDLLDEADYIKDQYYLEVSSPGLERMLRKEKHFLKQIGNEVYVKLFAPINKQKELVGILEEYNANDILLKQGEESIRIDFKNIALVKTTFEW